MITSWGHSISGAVHLSRIRLGSVKIRSDSKKRNLRLILEVDGLTWELLLDSKKIKITT
jgi:hypothetical protein